MPHTSSQTFLRELDKKLWTAADKLRSNLDAAVYKQAVLGLIFLKYVSDSAKLPAGTEINMEKGFSTPFNKPRTYRITSTGKLIDDALEAVEKENPKLKNVPVASVCDRRTLNYRIARRKPHDFEPNRRHLNPRKTSDGRRPTLPLQIDPANLAGLINLIATIQFLLTNQFAKSVSLERAIKANLRGLGYAL